MPASIDTKEFLTALVEKHLDERRRGWLDERRAEIGAGVSDSGFAGLLSLASRFSPRGRLEPDAAERSRAGELVPGWDPERWTTLEALRVVLVLARNDLEDETFGLAYEEAFRYADEGELRALYKALAVLPGGERFTWRAGEGCRTNIVPVFESVACDSPYPSTHLDDTAWNQLVIKAVFIDAPLWRVWGLDGRLSPELARMALDLADERRSAGRPVQPELWLCLGEHAGERGLASLEEELASSPIIGRRAAALGLARAGCHDRLRELLATETVPEVADTLREALDGRHDQLAFRALDPREA